MIGACMTHLSKAPIFRDRVDVRSNHIQIEIEILAQIHLI